MTDHNTLLQLLGEWVTVTHPDASHRVWHGQLASLMGCPSLVLQMPGGGTEVLPQAFNVHGAAPAPGGPHPDPDARARSFAQLRDSGLLWLINRTALHPRGLALALHLDEHGQAYGWSLVTNDAGEPWQFDPATDNDGYVRAEATIAQALERVPDGARCCVCGGRPVVYENFKDQSFCAGCANCECGQDQCVRARTPAPLPDTSGQDVQTVEDDHPDAGGLGRAPILGTSSARTVTSTDTVRTLPDADASGHLAIDPDTRHRDGKNPAVAAWGNCWDRTEALRRDLETAAAAYENLRTQTIMIGEYVRQQRRTSAPFGGGDSRWRVLDTINAWNLDPQPLALTTLAANTS